MIFVRDKGQMCNNIYQYAHVYALAREHGRQSMSMRFAHKYRYFHICQTRWHNPLGYLIGKWLVRHRLIPLVNYGFDLTPEIFCDNERTILSHRHVMVEGWTIRYHALLKKYLPEVRALFAFRGEVRRHVTEVLKDDGIPRIGLHIRRGDYRTWNGGRFYFEDEAYIAACRRLLDLLPGTSARVYVCGNDPHLDKARYERELGVEVVFPGGNPGEDLCLLSECDFVMGPPSSFSLMATLYERAKLFWMGTGEEVALEHFHDFLYWSERMDEIMA